MDGDAEVVALLRGDTNRSYTDLQKHFMKRLPYLATLLNSYVASVTGGEMTKWDICEDWYNGVRTEFVGGYVHMAYTETSLSMMEAQFLESEKERIRAAWSAQVRLQKQRAEMRSRRGPPRRFVTQQPRERASAFGQLEPRRPAPAQENVRKEFRQIMANYHGTSHTL